MKLTDEHRKLVTDNHNLIYGFAKLYNLDIEEWYDILAIAMCKAIYHYNGKTKLSTFVYTVMKHEMIREITRSSRPKHKAQLVSYDQKYNNDEHNDDYSLLDDYICDRLDDFEKQVLQLKLQGFTDKQVSMKRNVNRYKVTKAIKHIRELYEEGYRDG